MSKFYLTLLLQIFRIPHRNPLNFPIIYIFSSLPFLEGRAGTAWKVKKPETKFLPPPHPPYNDIIVPNIKPVGYLAVSVSTIGVFIYEYIDKT